VVILMEAFWIYPWFMWMGHLPVFDLTRPPVSLASVIVILMISQSATRFFRQREWPMWRIQLAIIGSGFIVMFLALRVEYGNGYALFDGGWSAYFLQLLKATFTNPYTASLAIPMIFFLWWRGILLERRTSSFESIYALFVIGIAALILLIIVWQITFKGERYGGALSAVGLNAIAFFCFGLISLAVRNLYLKRKRMTEKETKSSVWRSLAIILGAIGVIVIGGLIVASILSPGFFDAVANGFKAVWGAITTALRYILIPLQYVVAVIYWVLKWLLSLIPKGEPIEPQEFDEPFRDEVERTVKEMPQIVNTILQLLVVAVFLTVVIIILVKAIRRFKGSQDDEVEEIHESVLSLDALKNDLEQFLKMLSRLFRRKQKSAILRYDDDVGRLNIREIYKRLLWEGSRSGVTRRRYETPFEYAGRLGEYVPDGTAQLNEITGFYSVVRYGEIELPEKQVDTANGLWVTLRDFIRRIGEPDE
jgi:hypothetical protein